VANGGKARSQGFEGETQVALFRGLTANAAVSYVSSKSLEGAFGPFGPVNLNNGAPVTQGIPIDIAGAQLSPFGPKWTVQVGGQYQHEVAPGVNGYVRADYRWTSKYLTSIPGTTSYAPDANIGIATDRLNLRAGVEYKGFDINAFVNNIFSQKGNPTGGRGGCPTTDPSCSTFSIYNPFFAVNGEVPRVYGLQIAYRH
jgi:outer membrane receptor protein involved in Fe transport